MRFKKPRGLQPNLNPGQQGRLGSFGRGSNLPPTAAQLGSSARYSSGVWTVRLPPELYDPLSPVSRALSLIYRGLESEAGGLVSGPSASRITCCNENPRQVP